MFAVLMKGVMLIFLVIPHAIGASASELTLHNLTKEANIPVAGSTAQRLEFNLRCMLNKVKLPGVQPKTKLSNAQIYVVHNFNKSTRITNTNN